MRIAVTGSTGLIGTALVAELSAAGHQVVRLVRRPPTGPGEVCWDPHSGAVDLAGLAGVDAVVNLAGAGIGDRPEGAGIRGMRERAMLVGATLALSSAPPTGTPTGPAGTRLQLTIPNHPDRRPAGPAAGRPGPARPEVGHG